MPTSRGPIPSGGIHLRPCLRRRAWGGERLERLRPDALREPGEGPFGESWELADLPDAPFGGDTAIETTGGGPDDATLSSLLVHHRQDLLGRSRRRSDGRFPLLLKHLDAATPLSVQCHPSPRHAAAHPGAAVKHEGWFVIDAAPDAVVHRGFRRSLDRAAIEAAIDADRLHEELVAEPVAPGDFVWLPSGTCHALGGGLLVAEVQTPSDTTYRVHDWSRNDPSRPLHRDQARSAVDGTAASELPEIVRTSSTPPIEAHGFRTWPLHRGEWFDIELIDADADTRLPIVTNGVAVAWMVLEGEWRMANASGVDRRRHGMATLLWPAASSGETVEFTRRTRFLRVALADEGRPEIPVGVDRTC